MLQRKRPAAVASLIAQRSRAHANHAAFGGESAFIAVVGGKDYRAVETNDVTPENITLVFEDDGGTPINLFE